MDNSLPVGFENMAALKVGITHFKGNSFNYKVGAYHLLSNTKHYVRDSNYDYRGVKSNFSELGISASVGNQWHWDNFTIGADWIGINRALLELEAVKAPFKRTNMTTLSLLNIQIGYSF